jgi:hypothetical protein
MPAGNRRGFFAQRSFTQRAAGVVTLCARQIVAGILFTDEFAMVASSATALKDTG